MCCGNLCVDRICRKLSSALPFLRNRRCEFPAWLFNNLLFRIAVNSYRGVVGLQRLGESIVRLAVAFCEIIRNFNAALKSRRFATELSSISCSQSTTHHRSCVSPLIFSKASSKHFCQFEWACFCLTSFDVSFRCSSGQICYPSVEWSSGCHRSRVRINEPRHCEGESRNRTFIIMTRQMIAGLVLKYSKDSRFAIPSEQNAYH